jgi:pimeloyl-ACP methyl ester carboxylesterase
MVVKGNKNPRLSLMILEILVTVSIAVLLLVGYGLYSAVRPPKIASGVDPATFGFEHQTVNLKTSDEINMAAWLVSKKGEPNRSAIVVLHGYPADKGDLLASTLPLAKDHNLFYLDFRYFGESSGLYSTIGARETAEVMAATKYLRLIGMETIGVYGFSMGGAVALMSLRQIENIDAVAVEAAYAELGLMLDDYYRHFGLVRPLFTGLTRLMSKIFLGLDVSAVSPQKAVVGTEIPVLLMHSRQDTVIPFKNAELLAHALSDNQQAEFLFTDSGVHGSGSEMFSGKMADFFRRHLLVD